VFWRGSAWPLADSELATSSYLAPSRKPAAAAAAAAAALQGDFVVAFLDIVGPELNKPFNSNKGSDAAPQLKHLLRQALLSCSGGVRLDEEVNGPMQLLDIQVNKSAGALTRCSAGH
jgi:hypothetical protein